MSTLREDYSFFFFIFHEHSINSERERYACRLRDIYRGKPMRDVTVNEINIRVTINSLNPHDFSRVSENHHRQSAPRRTKLPSNGGCHQHRRASKGTFRVAG